MSKTNDLPARKTSVAWPPFTQTLARVLAQLEEDQYLVISAKHSNHFVQFAGQGSHGLRAETTSNAYLNKTEKLDKKQLGALIKAGWCKPTNKPKKATPELDPDGSPNYFSEFPVPVATTKVAKLAVSTLAEILRIPHPGMLEYEAFDGENRTLALIELGLKPVQRKQDTYSPKDLPAIACSLLETMRELTGIKDLNFDSDGDVAIRYGSAAIFARVIGEPPGVHLFCPLVTEVSECPDIYERLNAFNGRTRQIRFFWREGTIYAVADIPAAPYVAAHVIETCQQFFRVADDVDDLLQADFGGKTMFDEWTPSTARH